MILQTLTEYYQEQVATGNPDYAPAGMELKRIHYVLLLSHDGLLVDIEEPEGKLFVAQSRQRAGKDASSIANRMWDNVGYVTGYAADPNKQQTAQKQHIAFEKEVIRLHQTHPNNHSFAAVASFLAKYTEQLHQHALWPTIRSKTGHNLSFRLIGNEQLAAQQPELLRKENSGDIQSKCLVCGQKQAIARLHPKLHIYGGSPTGCKLISFTQGCGYNSYHKTAGENAPVSIELTESYSAALTGLLQMGSNNNVVVNHISFLFYTLPHSNFVNLFRSLLDPAVESDREQNISLLNQFTSDDTAAQEFILLALVSNTVRISVRLFLKSNTKEVARNTLRFYTEATFHCSRSDKVSILTPLLLASPLGNIEKLPPQLIIDYVQSVICNTPFPKQLQSELLNRQREQKGINQSISSTLHCILNRIDNPLTQTTPMALDKEYPNIGYQLGRLFAILERSQELSNPGITFTIRDTYYTIASVTPGAIFNRLITLSGSYFRHISTKGTTIFLKNQLGEVIRMLDCTGIPQRLSLDDQSRFAIGYFHQRQTYFTPKEQQYEQSN